MGHFSAKISVNGVKRAGFLPKEANYPDNPSKEVIALKKAVGITGKDSVSIEPFKNLLSEDLIYCMDAVGAESGSIFLFDIEHNDLVLAVSRNNRHRCLAGLRRRIGEGIAGKVALERQPLLVRNVDEEKPLDYIPKYNHYKSKSFLSVPLESFGDLVGVVNITDKTTGSAFDDQDLFKVLHISRSLGISIGSLKDYLIKQQNLVVSLKKQIRDLNKEIIQHKKFSSLGRLVAGFVHEINNPLDGIIRYVNLSLAGIDKKEQAKKYLNESREGLMRISTLIRSLLDFCWSLSPHERKINVNRVIEECLFLSARHCASYKIAVEKNFSESLPKVTEGGIKVVFNNIIKNACDSMRDSGGTLTVRTSVSERFVNVEFSDTGKFIPSEIQDKIFEPFFTTKARGKGSGLGLAISKEIISNCKGEIYLRSGEGQLNTFIVKLPFDMNNRLNR